MRTIKFRAWGIEDKRMYHFSQVGTCSEYNTLTFNWDWKRDGADEPSFGDLRLSYDPDKFVLMEYTGLKDRDGVEIYEGDIVKAASGVIGQVIFQNGSFYWTDCGGVWPLEQNDYYKQKPSKSSDEVIGNIYEHSHLLKP